MSSRSDAASSSGYESMRNDASHASSDSCSEKGLNRSKKKGKNINFFKAIPLKGNIVLLLQEPCCRQEGDVIDERLFRQRIPLEKKSKKGLKV